MCSPSKKKHKPNGSDRSPPPVPKSSYTYSPRSGIFSAPAPVPVLLPSSSSQSHAHARYNNACNNVNNSYYVPNHPQSQLIGIGNGKGIANENENENFVKNYEEVVKKVNDEKEDDNAYFNSFPPGFRFVPTDQELLLHYLKKKIDNEPLPRNRIHEVNISDYNPETIAGKIENYPPFGDKIWYFFTPRERKYVNGIRPKRAAGKGYWKATGKDKVFLLDKKESLGKKKTLVFYEGKPPKGDKTNWIMHEYRMGDPREKTSEDDMRLDDNVLCRIYKKNKSVKDSQQQQQDVVNNYVQSQTVEDQVIQNNPITTVAADALPPVPLTTAPTMITSTIIPSAVPLTTVSMPSIFTVNCERYTFNKFQNQLGLHNSYQQNQLTTGLHNSYTYQESPMMTVPNNLYSEIPMTTVPNNLYSESPMMTVPNNLCSESPMMTVPNNLCSESPMMTVPNNLCSESPMTTVPNNLYEESWMMTGLDNSYDENLCPNPQGLDFCWAKIIPNNPSSLVSEEKKIF